MSLTKQSLLEYLKDKMGLDTDSVEEETPLFSSGLLDSFSMVDLLMFVEKACGQRISPTEVSLDNLDSVSRILQFAEAKAAD